MRQTRQIEVEVDGVTYRGTLEIDDEVMTIHYLDRSSEPTGVGSDSVARTMLAQLVRESLREKP